MELAQFDDAAPVKKRHFVNCYQQALNAIFNPRCLRVGWKAVGLFSWNPKKALNSSQVHSIQPTSDQNSDPESLQTLKRLRTVHGTPLPPHDPFRTPTHPRDLHHFIKSLEAARDMTRDFRTVLNTTSKAFSHLTTQHTFIQASNQQLQQQLKELEDKRKKKKVSVDPNLQFVNIESIKQAMEEVAVQEARIQAKKPEEEARRTSSALVAADMQQFMSEWQV
ncbi:hypothetical protein HOY80DRAFT_1090377 [Tuber brumale]|nr:hypothetical protein HOY80DRAFT_1090377 [Tuber brumale]